MNSREEIHLHLAIVTHVKKHSTLYNDSYSAYVNHYKKIGYCHKFINHQAHFVSSIFEDIHTNTVERLWRTVKTDLKKSKVTTKYVFGIARFTFLRILTKTEKIAALSKGLKFTH